ncbi:caveolin-2-like [Rhinoraja longicauda]
MEEGYTQVELDDGVPGIEWGREGGREPSPPHGTPDPENRDPQGMNQHLTVDFGQMVAEPFSTHSFDRVWAWSHVSFEVCKLWGYRAVSLIFAVPASIAAGCLFACAACLHIWCLVPCARICLLSRPTWQTFCLSLTDTIVAPLCSSMAHCLRGADLTLARH